MGGCVIIVMSLLFLSLSGAPVSSASHFEKIQALQPFQDCEDCPEVMPLPPGRFVMGASNQRDTYGPAHDRAIAMAFAIGTTEVTFNQYEVCVQAGVCRGDKSDHGWGRGQQPVINVSWSDANDYAAWLSRLTGQVYRLPTEAEWEYAARAGTVTRFPWGDEAGEGHANCRHCGTEWSGMRAAPVAQFPPNAFGLFDMNGNVSEWVSNCWRNRHSVVTAKNGKDTQDLEESGQVPCPTRVTRGGDWYYIPVLSTSAARKSNAPNLWSYTIGFRVVRELP